MRFGLASAPSNLDPRFATDATSARINRLLYERLVDFTQASQPVPSLAMWEMLTPTHYRFRLKNQNSQFHDGSPLTSRDVKTTYDFILDPQHSSPHRSSLKMIDHIEVPSEDIIDFHLARPDLLFPGYLIIGILPARLVAKGHPFHSHPVGSGPFAFRGRPDESRLQLVRRSDNQPFEFIRVPDPTVRALKLLAGEIDMMQNDLPPELVASLAKNPQVHIPRGRGTNFAYLGFNLQDPLTGQLVVRQAVAHAIDREAIIRLVLGGSAHLAESLLPPDHWAGDSSL
ncbi:MAG: ABC transporter substrate-binding protein, partial [Nitrospirales bacterium]